VTLASKLTPDHRCRESAGGLEPPASPPATWKPGHLVTGQPGRPSMMSSIPFGHAAEKPPKGFLWHDI